MRALRSLFALLAGLAVLPLALAAQRIPPHPTWRDFEPFGYYQLELGGALQPQVKLYQRASGAAVLINGPGLPGAFVIVPAEQAVKRVAANKVMVGPAGFAHLLADAVLLQESPYQIVGSELTFTIDGRPARLREKPHLLGLHPGKDLLAHDVAYAFKAQRYEPAPFELRELRKVTGPVRVRVFFGSWCPHCREIVPRILRAAQALESGPIKFEYYGLPLGFGPQAKSWGITEVPYAVLYRGEREIARIAGQDLRIPERAIRKAITGEEKASR